MLQVVKRLWQQEDGQGLVEYAVILGFVALVVIVSFQGIGPKVKTMYVSAETAFE